MATKTVPKTAVQKATKKAPVAKPATGRADPAKAIGDAARGFEHDLAKAVRAELRNLRKALETIQRDAQKAIGKIEVALDPQKATRKPPARKTAKK